jgi:ATP-binding cassette subfamily B protein
LRVPLRRYWSLLVNYLRPQKAWVAALAALLLGGIALQLAIPQILRWFIDTAREGGAEAGGDSGGLATLTAAALLFLAVALAQQAVTVAATYVGENVGWTATNALRADLALHCLRLDLAFHNAHTPGEMIERIDGDINALANFFSQFVIRVLGNLILLFGVLALLFREDARVGLAFSGFVVVALAVLGRMRNVAVPHWAAARGAAADLFGFIEERLAGTEDLRSRGATAHAMRRLYALLRARFRRERKAGLMGNLLAATTIGLFTIGYAAAFALGGSLFASGALTLGTVYLIFHYTEMLNRPMLQITAQLEDLQKASAGIGRVQELLQTASGVQDPPAGAALSLPPRAPGVEFDRVSFAYGDGAPVLHELSFRLAPGRILGLLGRTGSGKTTIARLLTRAYDPTAGAVRLAARDLRDARLAELRARVGLVTQEVQLFHGSVRDNLTFFDRAVADERLLAALEALGLLPWYRALPEGLDTALEPGGRGLSAGEAQLLALARVFLKDPGLVILDEASSRLDPATEALLEGALDRLLAGRTAIIIAHRLATVARADAILILEGGRIVEHDAREVLAHDPASRFAGLLRTGLEEALA